MKVLFLTDSYPDYLADDLLYGLRTVLGSDVIDFPRKDVLYADSPWRREAHRLYGAGFNCFGLPEQPIDRTDLAKKIEAGYFDAIINSSADRIRCPLHPRLVVMDGGDNARFCSRYLDHVPLYFKRELAAPRHGVEPILFALPDFLNDHGETPRVRQVHASFKMTSEVRRQLAVKYPPNLSFNSWTEYRNDMRECWFALSPKGVGHDCQRHYEVLGQAVLCLYLDDGAPALLRHYFKDGENCLTFATNEELFRKIDNCTEPQRLIEQAREDLRQFHLASKRATQMLATIAQHVKSTERLGWLARRGWRTWLDRALKLHTRALDS